MNFYYVNVIDRFTGESVNVGAMLTLQELRELVGVLQKYNSNDIIILKGIEKL